MHQILTRAITSARLTLDMTPAEFDHSLSQKRTVGVSAAHDQITMFVAIHATEGIAEDDFQARSDVTDRAWDAVGPELVALIDRACGKSYTGWSDASREPVRYA